jgi:hypothetical protein
MHDEIRLSKRNAPEKQRLRFNGRRVGAGHSSDLAESRLLTHVRSQHALRMLARAFTATQLRRRLK